MLRRYKVGLLKGVKDREIVVDAFFSRPTGVVANLYTGDVDVFQRLAQIAGLPKTTQSPFEVTINGRTIRVVPIPD